MCGGGSRSDGVAGLTGGVAFAWWICCREQCNTGVMCTACLCSGSYRAQLEDVGVAVALVCVEVACKKQGIVLQLSTCWAASTNRHHRPGQMHVWAGIPLHALQAQFGVQSSGASGSSRHRLTRCELRGVRACAVPPVHARHFQSEVHRGAGRHAPRSTLTQPLLAFCRRVASQI